MIRDYKNIDACKKQGNFSVIALGLVGIGALLASCIKFNWVVGSFLSFFSAQQVFLPLVGAFGGVVNLLPRFQQCPLVFLQALGSAFIAHAVGSVIWLYTVGMTPAAWLGLIPVVFVERMLCAAGMTVAYYGISGLASVLVNRAQD